MAGLPESEHCPTCGSPDYITVHPAWAGSFRISLRAARRCADCDSRYAPPIPVWFTAAAILAGGCVFVGSLGAARFIPEFLGPGENAARIGVATVFSLLAAGALAIVVKAAIALYLWPVAVDRAPSMRRQSLQAGARKSVDRDGYVD